MTREVWPGVFMPEIGTRKCHCGREVPINAWCECVSKEEISERSSYMETVRDGLPITAPEHHCLGPKQS